MFESRRAHTSEDMSLESIVGEDERNLSVSVAFDAYGGDVVDGITAC